MPVYQKNRTESETVWQWRRWLKIVLVYTPLSGIAAPFAAAGDSYLQHQVWSSSDMVYEPGSCNLFSDYSFVLHTELFDQPVTVTLTPEYDVWWDQNDSPDRDSPSCTQDGASCQEAAGKGGKADEHDRELRGVVAVFQFEQGQQFMIDLYQNNDISPEDDALSVGETYSFSRASIRYILNLCKDREGSKREIDMESISVYDLLSPYILATMERLLEYRLVSYRLDTPCNWWPLNIPVNGNGEALYKSDNSGRRFVNLAYFFPTDSECGRSAKGRSGYQFGHDACLRPNELQVEYKKDQLSIAHFYTSKIYVNKSATECVIPIFDDEPQWSDLVICVKGGGFTDRGQQIFDRLFHPVRFYFSNHELCTERPTNDKTISLSKEGSTTEKRKRHTAEFKANIALAAHSGDKTIRQLARESGATIAQVNQWKQLLVQGAPEIFGSVRTGLNPDVITAPLYQEIGRLKMELDALKSESGNRH